MRQVGTALVLALALSLAPASAHDQGPDDPHLDLQWGLEMVNAVGAWETVTGAGVRVGIVDDGVHFEHPDLAGKVTAGTSFVDCPDELDGCGTGHWRDTPATSGTHGTFAAGIIAARAGNGEGIAGVAPDAELLSVTAVRPNGSLQRAESVAGMRWAIDQGVDVLNLSWGGGALVNSITGGGSEFGEILRYAAERDVVVVAIAGNQPVKGCDAPGREAGAICVTAVGPDGAPAAYSSSALPREAMAVAAPGGAGGSLTGIPTGSSPACALDVLSTVAPVDDTDYCPGVLPGYGFSAGTSFAVPHVVGIAALLAQQCRSAAEIARVITETARNPLTGERGVWHPTYGYGIVDAAAAVATPVVERRTTRRPHLEHDHCIDP